MMINTQNNIRELRDQLSDRDANVALVSLSILGNILMTLAKIVYGIQMGSGWLLFNALYLMVIGGFRYKTLKKYIFAKKIPDREDKYDYGYRVHQRGGFLFLLLGLVYLMCCIRMYLIGDVVTITGQFVYLLVLFTAFKLSFAIYGMIKTRKKEEPIVRTMKDIGFEDAGVAFVEMVYAYLALIGDAHMVTVSAGLGFVIAGSTVIGGIKMYLSRRETIEERMEFEA